MREHKPNNHNILWLKIEKHMKTRQINQNELARRANINNTVVSALKLEKIKKPSFELITKIADALEVSLDEFREEQENE